jgi:hypothetical protein
LPCVGTASRMLMTLLLLLSLFREYEYEGIRITVVNTEISNNTNIENIEILIFFCILLL